MKKIMIYLPILAIALIFTACTSRDNPEMFSEKLPLLEIDIPDELQGNEKIENFIESSTELLNNSSDSFENFMRDINSVTEKEDEELSMSDNMQLIALVPKLISNLADATVKFTKMESNADFLKSDLTEDEEKAFELVLEKFKNRIKQLEKKYKEFGKEIQGKDDLDIDFDTFFQEASEG